jgi:type II secretory pathway component GspD/PulD (secretin)
VKDTKKTELIIFLTPYIVMAPKQLAHLSEAERTNTELMPKAFTEQELNRFLDAVPTKPPEPLRLCRRAGNKSSNVLMRTSK